MMLQTRVHLPSSRGVLACSVSQRQQRKPDPVHYIRNCTSRSSPSRLHASALVQRSTVRRASSRTVCQASRSPTPGNSKFKRSIWTAVDVVALLGSVGGALAALLGVFSPTYALVLPLVLPVVSLIAALQREDLVNEEGRQYLSELSSSIGRDSTALLREAAAAIEEVRNEARSQSAAAARLAAIEDKLAVLEGAVVGAARSSREAAMGVNALGSALSQTLQQNPAAFGQAPVSQQAAQMLAGYVSNEVVPLVKAELGASLGPWLAENSNGLKRLDTRLAVVEGSLAGLEMAQSDGLRSLSGSINSSLVDAESALQNSVRIEVATAVEPLKQLPQLVTAAAAKAATQQQQLLLSLPGTLEGEAAAGSAVAGLDQSVLLEQVRELVAAEVATALQQVLSQQAEVLSALAQPPRPSPLPEDQWDALGRRLSRLERLVQSVPELGEQAIAGQIAPLLSAQQAQQAAADSQENAVSQLLGVAEQITGSYARLGGLISEFEGLRSRLDEASGMIMSNVARSEEAAAASSGSEVDSPRLPAAQSDQMIQQLQSSVQQLLQQTQYLQVQGLPGSSDLSDQIRSLQQQVEGLGAALQQVQMDIPVQIQLAFSQSSAEAAGRRDVGFFDGSAFDEPNSSNAAAAASSAAAAANAASAAAQGIAEVRQLLGGLQQSCENLKGQVSTLASQVAAQQAAMYSNQQEAAAVAAAAKQDSSIDGVEAVYQATQTAQQQLADAGRQISADLSQQLSQLCSKLEQQLQDLQQQLVAVARSAATQAAQDAAAAAAAPSSTASGNAAALEQRDLYYRQTDEATAADSWAGYQQQPQPQLGMAASSEAQQVLLDGTPPPSAPVVAANPAWAGDSGSSNYATPEPQPGTWLGSNPVAPPTQQQQVQPNSWPQGSVATAAAPGAGPESKATTTAAAQQPYAGQQVPPQQQQQPMQPTPAATPVVSKPPVIPNIGSLTEEQLRTEGLRLLRAGREATSGTGSYAATGPDFAAAETQLQAAVACFSAAVESEPQDTRALGNLGNALLAQGELKKGLLDELRLSAAQGGLGFGGGAEVQQQSIQLAENRLRSEAVGLLTRAGEIFRRVLEVDGWSSRALVNWGKALVGRAELASELTAATKLYNAAIDKFEAVLEEDPGMIVAKYRCALAMQGLAVLKLKPLPGQQGIGLRQRQVLLQDASVYLSDVVAAGAGGDEGLREAAAAALRLVQEQLELAKLEK